MNERISYNIFGDATDKDENMAVLKTAIVEQKAGNAYVKPGDVNFDNYVDITDLIIVLQTLAGIPLSWDIQISYATSGADVNANGKMDMAEAIYILRKAAKLQ